jgi:hypothetical protein
MLKSPLYLKRAGLISRQKSQSPNTSSYSFSIPKLAKKKNAVDTNRNDAPLFCINPNCPSLI